MHAIAIADKIRVDVRRLEELPPLPVNVQRLLEVLSDEEVEIHVLADVIEQSPALAARVVGLARSAYFGNMAGVRSVSDAIIKVLGLSLVKSLATGIALSGAFDPGQCTGFSAERYWGSALLAAGLSRLLARHLRHEGAMTPDSAYLCGLLHNIGLVVLAHIEPECMSQVLMTARDNPEHRITELEQDRLGMHHCDAGALLARRWKLPPEVIVSIERHHDPEYRGEHWQNAMLVGVCARWGRQRLAGVAEPWIEPESLKALGLDDGALETALESCHRCVDEIATLTRLMVAGR